MPKFGKNINDYKQKKLSFIDFKKEEDSGSDTEEEEISSGESLGEEDTDQGSDIGELPEYSDTEDDELIDTIEHFEAIQENISDLHKTIGELKSENTRISDNIGLLKQSIDTLIQRIENGTKKLQKKI